MNSYETQYYLFNLVNNVMFSLLIISYIGIWSLAPNYLDLLRTVTQLYISLFLIIRFNPYASRHNFSDLDRRVAFSAGMFLITSTIISKYLSTLIKTPNLTKKNEDKANNDTTYV